MDYQTLVSDLYGEVDNKNTRVQPFIQRAIVRQLRRLSPIRTLFMEATDTFTTVDGQSEYDSSDETFLGTIQEIDAMWVETGSGTGLVRDPVVNVPLRSARWDTYAGRTSGQPRAWAWHHDKLIFAPLVSGEHVVKLDYFQDSTRDAATGDLITTTSTSQSNSWFTDGDLVLRNFVLQEYHRSISKDYQLAQACGANAADGLRSLQREYLQAKGTAAQAPRQLSEDDGMPVVVRIRR